MREPAVSVLIPVFNGEPFLAECLESVLAQDFSDFEVLISDDGSTDSSVALIERFAGRDQRIRWRRNPRNLGIGANFNACLKAARGQFIKYVLQDDKFVERSALRQMVDVLQGHPAVTLVMSAAQLVDGQSRLVRVRNRFGASGDCDGKQLIVRCFSQERANLIGEPSLALFRKSQAARGFDEGFRQLLDLEMWFHLLEQGRFGFIAEPLCAFRQHPAQHTELNARTGAAADEHLRLFERYYARPWMRQLATPRMLFMRMYYLREHYGDAAAPVLAQMSKSLGSSRYAAHLFAYKLSLRLRKFQRSLRKRGLLPRSLESLAAEP